MYDDYFDIVAEQNQWCNEHGQIPQNEFINRWHDLNNRKIIRIMEQHCDFQNRMNARDQQILNQIDTVYTHIVKHSDKHDNCANPNLEDEAVLKKRYGKGIMRAPTTRSIRSEFFQMMMLMREYYNYHMNIPIRNITGDKGTFLPGWDGLDPEYPRDAFEKNFEVSR
jgi:hypothetical protein